MWDFKLLLFNIFFVIYAHTYDFIFYIVDLTYPFLFKSFSLINLFSYTIFPFNTSIFFGIKFCLCITFLILIRGGTPRYRYDYLTKLGWLKFLSLVLLTFSFSLLFFILF